MLKKKLRRLSAMLMAGVMAVSMMGTAFAAEGSSYEESNSYVLNYNGVYDGAKWQYFSPYWPAFKYDGASDYTQSIAFTLYDTKNSEGFWTYCTDLKTGLNADSNFRRLNLEDSTYAAAGAGLLRSIVLKGFPNVGVDVLGEAAGVDGLTVGEAVAATQAAVWKAAHGDLVEFTDFCRTIDTEWSPTGTVNYDACNAEIANGYAAAENEAKIEAHIEAVYNYLISLEPTGPQQVAASVASFKSWSEAPVLTKNDDGSYNVTVSAVVDVVVSAGDDMTLTAVLGDYSASQALVNGKNTVELTIENVPADKAREAVILAIDGNQTVSDVFLFDAEGERGTSQSLVGILDNQLPVHAEVKVEPERKINIHKTQKVMDGENVTSGRPLEGVTFSVYKVCTLEEYLKGDVKLGSIPTEADIIKYTTNNHDYYDPLKYQVASVATDANGVAEINLSKLGQPDGVYLVVEEKHPAVEAPVDPFFVMVPTTNASGDGWTYEITVSPKNTVVGGVDIEKDVISVGNDLASVDAYAPHTWIIGATIPVDIANGKSYVISDTLSNQLDYLGNLQVKIESTMGAVALTKDVDYTLSVVDNDSLSEGKPADSFTVSLTKAGMKKAADNMGSMIRVYFDAQINANAELNTLIPNQADLNYTNSFGMKYDAESDIPNVYTGGANVLKVDGNNAEVKLAGAEFDVYRAATAEEITAQNPAIVTIDCLDFPVIPVSFFATADMSGEKVSHITTGADGLAYIYGLAEGEYYLVETKAPANYNLLIDAVKFEIQAKETKDSVTEISIVTVENFGGFKLPETGGIGTTVYTLMGSMTMAASGMYIFLKKRED